ncbi:MAG: ribosome biogenesis GTP-binding protein YihA/YsxC [Steroidobacteraceae bacterium]
MSRFSQARFLLSVASVAQFPPDRGVEVAFAGRSNAGKSTALNAVLGRRALARTGKTPGQTRLLNYFEIAAERRLVDLPGYGYARVPERQRAGWGPLLEHLRERRSLCGLFLIVDVRRGIGDLDLDLIDWAAPETRSVHVLLTKSDKLNRSEAAQALRAARSVLAERMAGQRAGRQAEGRLAEAAVSAQLFSAPGGQGVPEAQQLLGSWLDGPSPPGETRPADHP